MKEKKQGHKSVKFCLFKAVTVTLATGESKIILLQKKNMDLGTLNSAKCT